ncbi:unnamed protein product [Mesocestoides corti]|uniref:RING-type domain-containing protein n=1 Tax=Mesocestoides corti TaxID=53468 RepID=A0A0R3U8H2_MESCO|nr:unnamed protein product [Mesocestoides corti]
MRFVVASETESQVLPPFEIEHTEGFFETQQILIWPPASSHNSNIPSVFYFCEPLGNYSYRRKFHDLYNTLLTGNVLHSMQSHPESRQTSSLCPWYNFYHHEHYSYQSSITSVSDLAVFFSEKMLTRPILTDYFCPWSHVNGGGIWGILGGLFGRRRRRRRRRNWTASTSVENSVSGHDMAFLFNTSFEVEDSDTNKECRVDEEEDEAEDEEGEEDEEQENDDFKEEEVEEGAVKEMAEYDAAEIQKQVNANEVEVKENVENSESSGEADSTLEDYRTSDVDGADEVQSDIAEVEVEEVTSHEQVNVPEDTQSSRSSDTYQGEEPDSDDFDDDGYITHVGLSDSLHSRKLMCLCMGIGSRHGERVSGVCFWMSAIFAISPLSPLLNLMRHSTEPKAHLIGVLWMTPVDALSPFHHVPIPRQYVEGGEEVERPYPRPLYLRLLTLTAFLSNWLAWFSRIETYSSLGMSRVPPAAVSDPVAGCVLQPCSLGCGQSPLIDLWPLWLARRLLLLPFHLPRLFGRHISLHFFAFTDVDGI